MSQQFVLRRVEKQALADYDDPLWPVNVLLVLLAGFVAGLVVAQGDFHTPVLVRNGYVQLAALTALVVLLAASAVLLSRVVQRRMQIAVLASLLVHLWACWAMREYRLPVLADNSLPIRELERPVTLPDYHEHNTPEPSPAAEIEQPLETKLKEPEPSDKAVEKKKLAEPLNKPEQKSPDFEPQPEPVELKKQEIATPRQATRPAALDREQPLAKLDSKVKIELERPTAAARTASPSLEQSPTVGRKEAQPTEMRRPAPSADRAAPTIRSELARSELRDAQPRPAVAAIAMVPRRSADTLMPQTTRIEPGAASAAPAAAPGASLETATTAVNKQASTTANVPADAALRTPDVRNIGPSGTTAERANASSAPSIAHAPSSTVGSIERSTQPSATAAAMLPASAAPLPDTPGSATPGQQPAPLEATVSRPIRASAGGAASSFAPTGAAASGSAGESSIAGSLARSGPSIGRATSSVADMPRGGAAGELPALERRQVGGSADLPAGGVPLALPQAGMAPGSSTATSGDSGGSPEFDAEIGPLPRGEASGVPLVASRSTVGGPPGVRPRLDTGIVSPRARRDSELVHTTAPRLILERSTSSQAIDARVRDTAVEGLKQRDRQGREAIAKSRGGSAGSEQAVELGLDFLARHQSPDGSWSLHEFAAGRNYPNPGLAEMHSNTAGTGLALLAFLGAGYTHSDGKYRIVVERGLDWLVAHQRPDGDLFVPEDARSNVNVWLYSHGIASIALCEAYGMTRDGALRRPAQKALDFIAYAQSPYEGGWRYSPQQGSDTSVSGWQVMALKSGELAGLAVEPRCYVLVSRWLDHAQGAGGDPSRYAYRPRSTQEHQREPSRVMTAEALLMRQYLGWKRTNPNMVDGADWLRSNLPELGTPTASRPYGQRDAYYWYYATQVMFQMQGNDWAAWNGALRPLVLSTQVTSGPLAGSWDPEYPVPDRWGNFGGRIYVTAMHLLMLEVYYRHLPIYQNLE